MRVRIRLVQIREQRWYRGKVFSSFVSLKACKGLFLFRIKNHLQERKKTMEKNLAKTYNPKDFEDRIYEMWETKGCFRAEVDNDKKPFTIVMPPPNITGQLHMGHALDQTLQDVLTRWKRMQGYSALWLPGSPKNSSYTRLIAEFSCDLRFSLFLSRL